MKHKHAEFFTAIANGESLDDWECGYSGKDNWQKAEYLMTYIVLYPNLYQVRRKQSTHVVNGFTVPAPLRFAPAKGAVCFAACSTAPAFAYKIRWDDSDTDKTHLERGLVHLTKEAAIANAKAMCGINPESNDE